MSVVMGIGIGGTAYLVAVLRRMNRQRAYRPEFEDGLFHCVLPFSACATLAAAVTVISTYLRDGLLLCALVPGCDPWNMDRRVWKSDAQRRRPARARAMAVPKSMESTQINALRSLKTPQGRSHSLVQEVVA